ncbi:hypothetical protein PACILC2_22560 [Paenibacillus cisolokensis]|uniref:Uncharacterized protein n=1 Tax=Paenibacillus cisolokensis TaxID=1658519 RepID=A0ABQ4N694_9BACL|nr:hypothetical protein [Paenibacillus cisolokensis]GIQ63688.1 hypothetical protein PACILC2_22560 [Paenibacillus cisolokensis]
MCKHGDTVPVFTIHNRKTVPVDRCIADEIAELNRRGVETLGCCCSHFNAGKIVEYSNGFGRWKEHTPPPSALIDEKSVDLAKELGYVPFPYYYADGEYRGVWQMQLKTGDITNRQRNISAEIKQREDVE